VEEIKHNVPIEDSKFQKPAPEKPPAEEKKIP
jgi:hypothetical protein